MTSEKLKRFFVRIYEKAFDEDVFSSSAQVAFYFLFALFPLLLFLVNIFGFVLGQSNEMRQELFSYLRQVMPASAFDLVQKTLEEVVKGSSGGKLTIGILITLYSASAGIDSLRIALNAVYKLKEERDWWKRKLTSLLLTIAFGVLIFVALGIIFYGSQFVNLILGRFGLPISSPFLLRILSLIIAVGVLLLTFAMLYYYVPDHKEPRWQWITPGTIITILLWYLLSKCFSLYLQYFDTYAKTYGSLGAIIILMLWLYLTALVILIGGTINAVLDEFSRGKYKRSAADEAASTEKISDRNNAKQADDKSLEADSDEAKKLSSAETKSISAAPPKTSPSQTDSVSSAPLKPAVSPPMLREETFEPPKVAVSVRESKQPPADQTVLNLVVGSAFGLLMGIFFSKKDR